MDQKEKRNKKVSKQIIVLVILLLLVASAAVATCVKVFQNGTGFSQADADKVRAYLAATDSKDYGVTEEEADEWLKAFFAAEGEDSVEINRTLSPTKGYDVNGTKTMIGSGEFVFTNANGGTAFRVNEGASFTVEGISVDGEKMIGLGVNVKAKAKLVWKDGSINKATEYGILAVGDVTLENVAIEQSANWILLNKGASGKLTNVNFYMSGSAGIVVEAGAYCEIDGEDTVLERTGSCAIQNHGELVMKGGTTFMTTGYGIDNFATAEISNVTMNRSVTGGGIFNDKGAVVKASDCTFINNKYHVRNSGEMSLDSCQMEVSSGSAVYSDVGGVMELTDVYIRDTGYNGLYVLNSTVTVKDLKCELINSTAVTVMGKDSTVKVDGLEVDNCNVAIRNGEDADKTYGKITASNVTVKNADSYNIVSYGGVCDVSDSTLHPSKGYSVYIRNGSSELDSVKILGTSVEGKGGLAVGSSKFQDAKVVIKGDTEITGCMGSGISNDGTLTIYDVDIHDNNVSGKNERGTGIVSYGTIYLHDGKIHDNYATKYGAGIWLGERTKAKQAGKLYMYGGAVCDNTAGVNGGGITVGVEACLLEMRGGSITGNRAYGKGEGILLNGKFALYDADSFEDNDVYLYTDKTTVQVLSDKLSFEQMKIVPEGYSRDRVLVEFKDAKAATELCKHFTTRNHQFTVGVNDKNGILVNNIQDFDTTYDFSKAAKVTVTTFAQLKEEIESTKIGTSKVISIAADIVLTEKITLPVYTDIKLVDDGTSRTLTRGANGNLFVVTKASHLVMSGISQLVLDGGAANGTVAEHGLVTVKNFGYFVLEDNAVVQNAYNTGTKSDGGVRGAAVNLDREGYFILDGGAIKNCSSPVDETYHENYCAVYLATSSGMSVKNGTIADCNDRAVLSYGKMYMSGGSIDNCSHMKSGGAAFRGTTLVMTGGTIENCVSTNSGSAIFTITSSMMPEGYFQLDGGTICNNTVGTALSTNKTGGAIYVAKDCVFDFKSGSVSDNVAGDEHIKMSGAGINNAGTTNIGAGAVISGNVATLSHGGIYNTGTMTITGATITENESTYVKDYNGSAYGAAGAIYNKGTLYLDGAKVVNNTVGTTGTIYNDSGNLELKNMTFTGNVSSQNSKGVDLRVATGTKSATLSGRIIAKDSSSALRLDLDKYFVLAEDFSSDSEINLYLAGTHYDGRRVLAGNLNAENVACFTWTNASDGWHLAEDGCIYMTRPEAKIGETIYATLEAAIAAVKEGETIQLIDDVELSKQVKINKAITITTDGVENRVITSTYKNDFPIIVEAEGKTVVFKGSSADSKLIFEGTGETAHTHSLLYLKAADHVYMEYVDINNANRNGNGGGGAINKAVPLTLTNCNFTNCQVTATGKNGGAITGSGALTATNCTFTKCKATGDGGAIYCSGVVELTNCTFQDNNAAGNGGAVCASSTDGTNSITVEKCVFEDNHAGKHGGAFYSNGKREKAVQLTNCSFKDNTAGIMEGDTIESEGNGGAVYVADENTLHVKGGNFEGNEATRFGGAISMGTGTSDIVLEGTVTFVNNETKAVETAKTDLGGGAVMTGNGLTIISGANVTIKNNAAEKALGGGIYFNGSAPVLTLAKDASLSMSDNSAVKGNPNIATKGEKSVVLHRATDFEDSYEFYAGLAEAAEAAIDGDEIILTADIELDKQVKIAKSVTITTDDQTRTISFDEEYVNSQLALNSGTSGKYPIHVNTSGIDVTFKGSSQDAKLVIKGTGNTAIKYMLIYLQSANSVTMTNVDIQDANRTSGGGGGAINSAKGVASLTLENCNFKNCNASQDGTTNRNGGAVTCSNVLTVTDCTFTGCSADGQGGAIYCQSTATLTNVTFSGNEDANGTTDIAVFGNINLNEDYKISRIQIEAGKLITLGDDSQDSDSNNLTKVYLTGTVVDGSQLVTGSTSADTIFEVVNAHISVDANGYLVDDRRVATLVHGESSSYYNSLADAAAEAEDGDTIVLTKDIVLDEQVKIEDAVTITTDNASRKIKVSNSIAEKPIYVNASGKKVTFKGSSENAKLVIEGTGTTDISFMLMHLAKAESVTMEYVNIKDANRNGSGGGGAINSSVPLILKYCDFTNCKVTASSKNGGAITGSGSVKAEKCTFTNCQATQNGGAIFSSSTIELKDCTFKGNSADGNGGAVGAKNNLVITGDVTFDGNEAKGLGGAIYFVEDGTPVLTVNEGVSLEMTNSKDQNDTTDTDIAFEDATVATINLNGNYKINRIYAGAGTLITLGANSQDADSNNLTMVYLTGTVPEDGSMQLVDVSKVTDKDITADMIFAASVAETSVDLSADGYLVGVGKTAKLLRNGNSSYCDSLTEALNDPQDGDTIILMKDVELTEPLTIKNSVTITTDEIGRTISVPEGFSGNPILVQADSDDVITFRGNSADAELTFIGTRNEEKTEGISMMLIYLDAAKSATMEHVNVENAHRQGGGAGAIWSDVPLTLNNCDFSKCIVTGSSKSAGAVYMNSASLTATDCKFEYCEATNHGGAIYGTGADACTVNLIGCTFEYNKVSAGGGGAVYVGSNNKMTIEACTFKGNGAVLYGGAVGMGTSGSTLNLAGECLFKNNTSVGQTKENTSDSNNYGKHSAGAVFAPKNLTIESDAIIKMTGNQCTGYDYGDAISINSTNADNFEIESDAKLYVYDNQVDGDTDNDVCLQFGETAKPTGNGEFFDYNPSTQTSVQNMYTTLQSVVLNFRSRLASL